MCEYDFEDEVFDDVSQEAKDFIEELLIKKPKYVKSQVNKVEFVFLLSTVRD